MIGDKAGYDAMSGLTSQWCGRNLAPEWLLGNRAGREPTLSARTSVSIGGRFQGRWMRRIPESARKWMEIVTRNDKRAWRMSAMHLRKTCVRIARGDRKNKTD
jgi:hypothetical protein